MFFAALTFLSAVSISLTAAYFSVIGLATMFPGSRDAIIIMGGVLEVGKLVASVWLHHNWNDSFKFLKRYLLFSVVVLSLITSMGIFGFLSRSHVEHHASIEKEQAIIHQIDQKIIREQNFITRKKEQLELFNNNKNHQKDNSDSIITTLQNRVKDLKQEKNNSIKIQNDIIDKLNIRLTELDKQLSDTKPSGLFGNQSRYKELISNQELERKSISDSKLAAENKIQKISSDIDTDISQIRAKIDSILSFSPQDSTIDAFDHPSRSEIEDAYHRITLLESEKFEYGSKLRALEVEIGPILYIANLLNEWGGVSIDTNQAIRIVIITLIFVFDPLAILLLIASTMTFAKYKKEDLPADVKEIRNKLLDDLEEYLNEGGLADHFIDRARR
jgi:hypothetical protein